MPVNTAALKTFAPAMRRELLEAVGRKLDLLLHSQTPDTLSTYAHQITGLREQEAENRDYLLERVAYTWFNRLCALRYLDARGWHPFGCKVLMPAAEGETQPELLKLMRAGSLPAELRAHTNEARLHGLLDGQIPSAIAGIDPQGEVYRELVLASCRSYHQLLPNLFEALDDTTELLLPDELLTENSIAGGFRREISDESCQDVEIIGWLYQFYISEKKAQVIGKVVKDEDIPAATQLFTPNWIVKYMIHNTLGALWLAANPNSPLRDHAEFYIEPAEQSEEAKARLFVNSPAILNPEELTLLDPACGSGHILVEAYEVLKAIYLERGYQLREIPALVLGKNLFGLDIDERAIQMATFALLMKGRADDRRLFERNVAPNIVGLVNSDSLKLNDLENTLDLAGHGVKPGDVVQLKEVFEHSKSLGALIRVPSELSKKLPALNHLVETAEPSILASQSIHAIKQLLKQAAILSSEYNIVVANPPYLNAKAMTSVLKAYLSSNYVPGDKDMFAAFILRCTELALDQGAKVGLVTPFSWMYLSSFEKLRKWIIAHSAIDSLVELETNAFEPAMVTVCSFVVTPRNPTEYKGSFVKLSSFKGAHNQAPNTLYAIKNRRCGWFYEACSMDFAKIPGSPIAYWVKNASPFDGKRFSYEFESGGRTKTHDNDKYLRYWWEVNRRSTQWATYANGGDFRKYAGNQLQVVNWSRNALSTYELHGGLYPSKFWGREGITWGLITSARASFRIKPSDAHYSSGSPTIFNNSFCTDLLALGFLNSQVSYYYLQAVNPTLNTTVNDVLGLPLPGKEELSEVNKNVARLVEISLLDWNAYERSADFERLPLLRFTSKDCPAARNCFESCADLDRRNIDEAKQLEEHNNEAFIEYYGLGGDVDHEVPVEQITLTKNPSYRYGGDVSEKEKWMRYRRDSIAELLSYATGCMMGRYSLDLPGLISADSRDSQADQLAAYEEKVGKPLGEVQFKPDPDGIIPVLDGEWFEDDIVARTREFLEVTFPDSSVGENLRFIEDSLGKDIRKYFCSEFYKDHLQTYKKRPIYWMVQSPKKGFACLIYLHRYTKDTLNQVLNNYFRPYLQKLEARLAQLGLDQLNDDLPTRERTAARKEAEKITKVLKECQAWEQDALLPLAQQRIELDLDDGVKVNYLKLQDVLAVIPGLAAKED